MKKIMVLGLCLMGISFVANAQNAGQGVFPVPCSIEERKAISSSAKSLIPDSYGIDCEWGSDHFGILGYGTTSNGEITRSLIPNCYNTEAEAQARLEELKKIGVCK